MSALVTVAVVVLVLFSLLATFLPIAVMMALLPGMIKASQERERRRDSLWRAVGAELGGRGSSQGIEASVDGRALQVKTRVVSTGKSSSTYTDVHLQGVCLGLSLAPQNFLSGVFGGTDHRVGDRAFDDRVVVGGDERVIGLLGHGTRQELLRCPYTVRVADGRLTLTASGAVGDGEALRGQIAWARRLAGQLAGTPQTMPEHLAAVAVADPVAGVRRRSLEVLRACSPAQAEAVAATVLDDADGAVRVTAAGIVGRSDILLAVVGDAQEPESLRILALEAVRGQGVEAGVRLVAANGSPRLWRTAALACPAVGTTEAAVALGSLAPLLAPAAWPSERKQRAVYVVAARAVAESLGQLPHAPEAEDLLLQLLLVDDTETVSSALRSLGAVGTVRSVQGLNGVVDGAGILTGLGGEARKAVRAIQARAGGERGGVALAARGVGGLALPERSAKQDTARAAASARTREAQREG